MSADDWMPGLEHAHGAHAGYVQGACAMRNVKLHYTVGRYASDYSIGMDGYFQFYVPREQPSVQFAEADSLCWDSGGWNPDGPGIEFERWDWSEPLTDKQITDGGSIIWWLHHRYGIARAFYDGDRVTDFAGYICHKSLGDRGSDHQDHTDGVTADEFRAMVRGEVEEPEVPTYACSMLRDPDTGAMFVQNGLTRRYLPNQDAINAITGTGLCNPNVQDLPAVYLDTIPWDADDPYNPGNNDGRSVPATQTARAPQREHHDRRE